MKSSDQAQFEGLCYNRKLTVLQNVRSALKTALYTISTNGYNYMQITQLVLLDIFAVLVNFIVQVTNYKDYDFVQIIAYTYSFRRSCLSIMFLLQESML